MLQSQHLPRIPSHQSRASAGHHALGARAWRPAPLSAAGRSTSACIPDQPSENPNQQQDRHPRRIESSLHRHVASSVDAVISAGDATWQFATGLQSYWNLGIYQNTHLWLAAVVTSDSQAVGAVHALDCDVAGGAVDVRHLGRLLEEAVMQHRHALVAKPAPSIQNILVSTSL